MTKSANHILCNPKNTYDHRKFKKSCSAKNFNAESFFFLLKRTRYSDIPIKMYNIVHAGPKTESGGVNHGLLKVAYQVYIAGAVKKAPKKPTPKGITTEATRSFRFTIIV